MLRRKVYEAANSLLKRNRPQLLTGSLLKFFCSSNKLRLEDIEQRAVASFFVMQYIIAFNANMYLQNSSSIRERILNKQEFYKFILSTANKVSVKPFTKIEELGLEQRNIQEVLAGFEMNKGAPYDPRVFSQRRVDRTARNSPASNNPQLIENSTQTVPNNIVLPSQNDKPEQVGDRVILNPFIHSGSIIHALITKGSAIVSGDKGIGKSFTYLLYSYLSSFIIEARIQKQYFNLKSGFYKTLFSHYRNFYNIQKIFYVPLRSLDTHKTFYQLLKIQMKQKETLQKINQIGQISTFSCINFYYQRGIKIFIVFDQINSFYSDARKHFLNLEKGINQQSLLEDLRMQSKILKQVLNKSKMVLNSSQDVQAKILQQRLRNARLFDYYEHEDSKSYNVKIDYSNFSATLPGLIEIYSTFWFQLTILLMNGGVTEKNIQQKRWIFEKSFNLSNVKQTQNVVPWKKNIYPLDVRVGLSGQTEIQIKQENKDSNLISVASIKPIELSNLIIYFGKGDDGLIEAQLKEIKMKIQKSKTVNLQNKLSIFLNHSTDKYNRQFRLSIIMLIRSMAYQKLSLGLQSFTIPMKKFYTLQKLQKTKPLNDSTTTIFEQINFCISELKIGTENKTNQLYTIGYRPKDFLDNSSFILEKIQFLEDIYEALIKPNKNFISTTQVGKMLDGGMARLFRRGSLIFNYFQHYQQLDKIYVKLQNINISHSTTILSLSSSKDMRECFHHMFEDCRKNKYLGFICGIPHNQSNEGFDIALLQRDRNLFRLITIDVTTYSIEDKLNMTSSKAKLSFNQYQTELCSFIESAIKTKDDLKKLIEVINKTTDQKFNMQQKIAIGLNICSSFPVRDFVYRQQYTPQQHKQNFQIFSCNMEKINMLEIFSHVKSIATDMVSYPYETYNTEQKYKAAFTEISSASNSYQLFYQMCVIIKFLKLIIYSGFYSRSELITFIQNCYNMPKGEADRKLIPKQLQSDPRLNQHHFFSHFRLLRGYCQPEGLYWTHLIAAPSHQVRKFKEKYKKNNSQLGTNLIKPFLFEQYSEKYGLKSKKLEFGLAQLPFDEKMIQFKQKPFHKEEDQAFLALKKQYSLLRNLSNHLSSKQ